MNKSIADWSSYAMYDGKLMSHESVKDRKLCHLSSVGSIDQINQKDDERNYKVSFKKINRILNFKIKFNFKSSIKKLVKKYQKEKINIKNFNYYNDKKILNILKQKKLY